MRWLLGREGEESLSLAANADRAPFYTLQASENTEDTETLGLEMALQMLAETRKIMAISSVGP